MCEEVGVVSIVDLVKPLPVVLGGADGPGTEEGCGGNEEEELRHLKLTCVKETGKSCSPRFFDIKM